MQAVDAWLQANGLTLSTLSPRKAMVQRMVGYLVGPPAPGLAPLAIQIRFFVFCFAIQTSSPPVYSFSPRLSPPVDRSLCI
jgi:hypothetical protein